MTLHRKVSICYRVRTFASSDSAWGIADQAIMSASNFVVTLILARALGPSDFGKFTLIYFALMFLLSIQGTLFSQPHNVLGATKDHQDYTYYTTASGLILVLFTLLLGAVLAAGGILASRLGFVEAASLIAYMVPIAIVMQVQEFIRRITYTRSRCKQAAGMSTLAYAGHALFVVILWHSRQLTISSALSSMTLAFALSLLVGLYMTKDQFNWSTRCPEIRHTAAENWRFGRWLLGGTMAYWLSTQMLPILVAAFLGPAATAGVRSVQNLVAPTHIFLRALETMVPSKASRAYQSGGSEALQSLMTKIAIAGLAILVSFFIVVSIFAVPITRTLLGAEYEPFAWLVAVFAIAYLLEFTSSIASVLLKGLRQASSIMIAQSVSAVFVLTVGAILIWKLGLDGAAMAMIGHAVLVNCILWYKVTRYFRNESKHEPACLPPEMQAVRTQSAPASPSQS